MSNTTRPDWALMRAELAKYSVEEREKLIENCLKDVIERHFPHFPDSNLAAELRGRVRSALLTDTDEGLVKRPDIGYGEEE